MGKLMQEFYEKEKALELAKEVEVTTLETNLNINAATRLILEQYKKTHSLTDQSIENESMKLLKNSIADKEDIDNGEVYEINTGQTIRDL